MSYEGAPKTMLNKYIKAIVTGLKKAKLPRLAKLDDKALETKIRYCLVLLTRDHLKYLMTPSLSDRAQFHREKKGSLIGHSNYHRWILPNTYNC